MVKRINNFYGLYMTFFEFEEKMKKYPFFTSSEVKSIFPDEKNILVQISFWLKKGYLIALRRGLYLLKSGKDEIDPMLYAGKLYSPSYLSLEFALNYYGIIPDIPGTHTSVTTRRTYALKNSFGNYSYQKVKSDFFTGYNPITSGNISFDIATPEKAIVDYLYLNKDKLMPEENFWRELRIDENFKFNKKKMAFYQKLISDKKVDTLVDSLLDYQKNAR